MKQYVGLLELIASSFPIPTAELLQDTSVLYAKLGKDICDANVFVSGCWFVFISLVCMSHPSVADLSGTVESFCR